MKNKKLKSSIITSLIIALSLFVFATAATRASETMTSSTPPKWCAEMVKMHEDFLKMLKAQDAELAAQVDKMKSASGDQKTGLIEDTLLLLIQQQSAQHSEMEKMVSDMKGILGKHGCSMMKMPD